MQYLIISSWQVQLEKQVCKQAPPLESHACAGRPLSLSGSIQDVLRPACRPSQDARSIGPQLLSPALPSSCLWKCVCVCRQLGPTPQPFFRRLWKKTGGFRRGGMGRPHSASDLSLICPQRKPRLYTAWSSHTHPSAKEAATNSEWCGSSSPRPVICNI